MKQFPILSYGSTAAPEFRDAALMKRVVHAKTEKEFLACVNDADQDFLCSILNLPVLSKPLLSNLKHLRTKRPILPIFVLKKHDPSEADLCHRLTVGSIDPEITLDLLLKLMGPETEPQPKRLSLVPPETVVNKKPEDFFAIRSRDFLISPKCHFDVYIKIGETRFLKLINQHEIFDLARVEEYMKKGISHFYLLKDQHGSFLSYCDEVSKDLLKSKDADRELIESQVLLLGDQILKNFALSGVNPSNIIFARDFLTRGMRLTADLFDADLGRKEIVTKALKKHEHSTAISILGGMLTRCMDISSPEKLNAISLALLLHDIGMEMLPENLRNLHNPDYLNAQDFELYVQHPKLAFELLKDMPEIPSLVLQAIMQHHERKDRTGYPQNLSGSGINIVSEIVGICDEYVFMTSQKIMKHQAFMKELDKKYYIKFSPQVIAGFKKIFS